MGGLSVYGGRHSRPRFCSQPPPSYGQLRLEPLVLEVADREAAARGHELRLAARRRDPDGAHARGHRGARRRPASPQRRCSPPAARLAAASPRCKARPAWPFLHSLPMMRQDLPSPRSNASSRPMAASMSSAPARGALVTAAWRVPARSSRSHSAASPGVVSRQLGRQVAKALLLALREGLALRGAPRWEELLADDGVLAPADRREEELLIDLADLRLQQRLPPRLKVEAVAIEQRAVDVEEDRLQRRRLTRDDGGALDGREASAGPLSRQQGEQMVESCFTAGLLWAAPFAAPLSIALEPPVAARTINSSGRRWGIVRGARADGGRGRRRRPKGWLP